MYVAKPQEQVVQNNGYHELFNTVEVKDDLTGEVIGTKNQSIGRYSLEQLEAELLQAEQNHLVHTTDIKDKIAAIKALQE